MSKMTCCKFSSTPTLIVPDFSQQLHPQFDVNAWCYFGELKGQKDTYSYTFLIQKVDPVFGFVPIYQIAAGINNKSIGTYDLSGCVIPAISVTQRPWSSRAICWDGSYVGITAINGKYGDVNTQYRITSHTVANNLFVEIIVEDLLGLVREGYGPDSFLPNWFLPDQRKGIMSNNGSVEGYMKKSGDNMSCQGSYYFSQPLLQVKNFTIMKNGNIIDTGGDGVIWYDYVCQTYDATGKQILQNCGWVFFAMQFPEDKTAVMITGVTTKLGECITANLFTPNNKSSWNIGDVTITPDKNSLWKSPVSKQTFYMHYTVTTKNPDAVFDIKTMWDEQEIVVQNIVKYEGLGTVEATINNKKMSGIVWLELQPIGSVSANRNIHTR